MIMVIPQIIHRFKNKAQQQNREGEMETEKESSVSAIQPVYAKATEIVNQSVDLLTRVEKITNELLGDVPRDEERPVATHEGILGDIESKLDTAMENIRLSLISLGRF